MISHCTVQESILPSVLDFPDNQLLLPNKLLPHNLTQPISSHNQLLNPNRECSDKFINVHTSLQQAGLCNFIKVLLGGEKIANANTLACALSVFSGSFLTFVRKPSSHRQFVVAPVSPNQLSFYRCDLNHSQFNIYLIINFRLFISEFLIIQYSLRKQLHYSLFISIFSLLFIIHYSASTPDTVTKTLKTEGSSIDYHKNCHDL